MKIVKKLISFLVYFFFIININPYITYELFHNTKILNILQNIKKNTKNITNKIKKYKQIKNKKILQNKH